MVVRTVDEGKKLAEELASTFEHVLGEWDDSDGSDPDVNNSCTRTGCRAVVGVEKDSGRLSHGLLREKCTGQ